MRNRHRRMLELTGLPGWMRFGYSPGWEGRSPSGLGPCAKYLQTGRWPTPAMNAAWDKGFLLPGFPTPYDPWGAAALNPEQELSLLKEEARQIQEALASLEERLSKSKGGKS